MQRSGPLRKAYLRTEDIYKILPPPGGWKLHEMATKRLFWAVIRGICLSLPSDYGYSISSYSTRYPRSSP